MSSKNRLEYQYPPDIESITIIMDRVHGSSTSNKDIQGSIGRPFGQGVLMLWQEGGL